MITLSNHIVSTVKQLAAVFIAHNATSSADELNSDLKVNLNGIVWTEGTYLPLFK